MTERGRKLEGSRDVVVVGAGIAGLALTRLLGQMNVSCVALENRTALVDAGLAINLPGNAIAALRTIGVGDELKACGASIGRREYRSGSGRLLFAVDEASFWGTENTPRCVRRSDLARLFMQGIPNDNILYDRAVTSATIGEHDVEIATSAGDFLSARYFVGADGVNSSVRKWCSPGDGTSIATLGEASWRYIAPNPGIDCWTVWMGKHAIFLLIPCGPNEVYGWATIKSGAADNHNVDALLHHSKDFPIAVRQSLVEAMAKPDTVFHSPLTEIRPSQWGRGRGVLIGDAAHATAPVWAQGAALALEDSLALALLLESKTDPSVLTEKLASIRQTRVRHVQAMTDRASRVARLPAYLRTILFPILGPMSYKNTYGPLRPSK
ncbi:FAD-dependent monooxygenase [Neorhizobium sp. NPDC001467]|uniref:FAD-dependent monooxygenase n=1 Tax=Neorhizobium sp. NPDC001467 TaxID=3390595 RepID=UPI003CFD3638